MAKATIVLWDKEDGETGMTIEFDPPVDCIGAGSTAQILATLAIEAIITAAKKE